MADMKGVWSLAEVKNKKGVVTSKAATYKIDGKPAAVIAGLSPDTAAESDGSSIDGITVDNTNLTFKLSKAALGTSNVKLTQKNGYKYTLELGAAVTKTQIQNAALSSYTTKNIKSGKNTILVGVATVTGDLTEGYTLGSATSVIYTAAKTGQTLATVSGLATDLETNDDGIIVKKVAEGGGDLGENSDPADGTTPAIQLGTGSKIVLSRDALAEKNATLKLDYAYSGYQLALINTAEGSFAPSWAEPDSDSGEGWSYNASKGTATYKGKVETAGYALALDGKTVTYIPANETSANLVKITGVKSTDGIYITETTDANYPFVITLDNKALTAKDVSVNKPGYKLELAKNYIPEGESDAVRDVVTEANQEADTWSVSKTTATYKRVNQAYYVYNDATNKVTYNKPSDITTYATISNLKSGLVVDDEDITKLVNSSREEDAITTNDTTFSVLEAALNAKKVTLKNGTDSNGSAYTYKLALTGAELAPTVESGSKQWSLSGTTATLKGAIEKAGYAQPDDNTITYAAASKKSKGNWVLSTLATVKGLEKNLKPSEEKDSIGTKVTPEGETEAIYTPGLVQDTDDDGNDVITLAKNVLGTTNVTLTSSAGFNYALQLDDGTKIYNGGGAVATSGTNRTFWEVSNSKLLLKDGKGAFYTATDKNTITYTKPTSQNTIATITGLKKNPSISSDASEVTGITIAEGTNKLILGSDVLNDADVEVSGNGGYTLGLETDDLKPHSVLGWVINGTVANLKAYTSDGYTASSTKKLIYSARKEDTSKGILAKVTGLKKGLVTNNGKINGIQVGDWTDTNEDGKVDDGEFTGSTTGKTIRINSKSVLTSTDVTLDSAAANKGYKFVLGFDESEDTTKWKRKSAGTVTCTVTTPAGYRLADDNTTVSYKKKASVTVTISGLTSDITADVAAESITYDSATATFTVDTDIIDTDKGKVTISGGNYTLALPDPGEGESWDPTISPTKWEVDVNKKGVATAVLKGEVTGEGYQISADGKTIKYFAVTNDNSSVANGDDDPEAAEDTTLATITGLAGIEKGEYTGVNGITGIKANTGSTLSKFTLSNDVLGTSKVSISGGSYTLALDSEVATAGVDATEWVTSGTTSTYKKYTRGYYTTDSTGSSIAYTAPTKGTTYATVKGIASGAELNTVFANGSKTLTLTADKLGASNVTISGTGYKLALDSGVQKTANPVTNWVTSGTTATYKSYSTGYYTKSSDAKITYTAPTKGTTIATVKGIKSGANLNSGSYNDTTKVLTLNASQLDGKKVTLTGDGYSLELANDVTKATPGETEWELTPIQNKDKTKTLSVNAAYTQNVSAGYTVLSGGKTITYSDEATKATLATLTGLSADLENNTITENDITVSGTTIQFNNDSLIDDGKTAKLTNGKMPDSSVATYTLAVDSEVASSEVNDSAVWTIDKKKGTAKYNVSMSSGFALSSDAKSITSKADAYTNTLFTVSGLNTTALKNTDNVTYIESTNNTAELKGFTVDRDANTVKLGEDAAKFISKKATVNNDYAFALNGILEPTAYENPKWFVSTVKSTTTAALKDGVEAGYTLSNNDKTVSLTAEQVGDARLTITGLKKGLVVSSDRQSVGLKDKDGNVVNGITADASTVSLGDSVLGTSDIVLEGTGYTFVNSGTVPSPGSEYKWWSFSNGTATYANKQNAGFTLSGDAKTFAYTKASSTTLATVKGLNKNYTGTETVLNTDGDSPLSVDTKNVITIGKDLVSTSKITVTVPKNSADFTLKLAADVAEQANQTTGWVTSGTAASYKDYYEPYYTVASNNKSITYNKPKDIKVYATLKGIKSGADLSYVGTSKVITLGSAQLANTNVSLSAGANNGYTISFANDSLTTAHADDESVTGWVTSGTTATYKTYVPGYYSYTNTKNVAAKYNKGSDIKADDGGVVMATIKGAKADITAEIDGSTFTVSGSELNSKVSLLGADEYAFNVTNYSEATITGSDKKDTITATGDALNISVGKEADSIVATGDSVTITAGAGNDVVSASGEYARVDLGDGDDSATIGGFEASVSGGNGNDTITVTGSGISVLAGAGNDSIDASNSDGNNVFIFAQSQGLDTITGFKADDAIKITKGTPIATWDNDDIVITFKGVDATKHSITLTELPTGLETITINGKSVIPEGSNENGGDRSANILLADDNYSADAANLSSIVQPYAATYTPYDFNTNDFSLTKEDKISAPEISYAKDDK